MIDKDKAAEKAAENGLDPVKAKEVVSMVQEARGFEKFLVHTSKRLVWLLTLHGCAWITASYVLAYLGREQIAESLSSTVCTVILGEMMTYLLTKTVENVFRYNPKFGGESSFPDDIVSRHTAMAQAQQVVAQAQAQTDMLYQESGSDDTGTSGFVDDIMSQADNLSTAAPDDPGEEPSYVDPSKLD